MHDKNRSNQKRKILAKLSGETEKTPEASARQNQEVSAQQYPEVSAQQNPEVSARQNWSHRKRTDPT